MFLYEKVAADAKEASLNKPTPTLTGHEQRRLDELEEDLPLQTIVMFRTMARREVRSWHRFCTCRLWFPNEVGVRFLLPWLRRWQR